MNTELKAGFAYLVEVVDARGAVIDREIVKNRMPLEGIHHVLNTVLKGGAQVANWFVGVYEGNYTPNGDEEAATLPVNSTECTAYTSATRPAFVPGTVADGTVDNAASRVELTFNASKTVYGGFISSASAKGSVSGVILSVVRFGSPKALDDGSVLRITAGFNLASA